MRRPLSFVVLILVGLSPSFAAEIRRVPADYKTIQAAIDAAKPGDAVLVEPGTYRESVLLKPRITVRSVGEDKPGERGFKRAESTIIHGGGAGAKGPAVVMADAATLDGFTITGVGLFDQKEFDKHFAERGENLPDERGAVGVEDAFPALSIPYVTAVVRNCIVRENGRAGIGCVGAKGKSNASLISKNVAYRNMGSGIGIANGATPIVQGNRCFNNLRGGIGNRDSHAIIASNECFENVRAGIGVREGATPIIRGNICYKNRRAGIGCRMEKSSPLIEENECYRNGMAGIGCRDGATPIIRKNRCHDNELAGIGCSGARPTMVENKCYRNKEAGIGVEAGGKATITRNECYENERAGIGQRGDAETTLIGNYLHHNKAAGIGFDECESGASVVMDNIVKENALVAVGIHSGWKVRFSGNELSRKEGLPPIVMVFKGAEAEFTGNTITGSGVAGIRTEGTVRISENTFICPSLRKAGPPQSAVWGLPGAQITFTGNTVTGWRHALAADKTDVTALKNVISGYWLVGMSISQPSSPGLILDNEFESDLDHPGVKVTGEAGLVENNLVRKPVPKK